MATNCDSAGIARTEDEMRVLKRGLERLKKDAQHRYDPTFKPKAGAVDINLTTIEHCDAMLARFPLELRIPPAGNDGEATVTARSRYS